MWFRALREKVGFVASGALLAACLLIAALVVMFCDTEPSLKFLQGVQPDPSIRESTVYRLTARYEDLERELTADLAGHGYVRLAQERWRGGQMVLFRSPDETKRICLVERAEAVGKLEVWVGTHERHSVLASLFGHGHRCGSPINGCIANLKQIEGAKANWEMEEKKSTNDIPRDSDLFGTNAYIRTKPTCPSGGVYVLGPVGDPPRCSYPLHTLP